MAATVTAAACYTITRDTTAAVVRLVGALLLEQSDEWATQRSRYMTLETITTVSDTPAVSLPVAAV